MRKLVRLAAFFAATTVLLAGCGGDDKTDEGGTTPPPAVNAPTIVLQNADIDKPQEIADGMSVKVDVAAPGGVKDFAIQIESPCLTEQVLGGMGLSVTMNLVTPASDAMAEALTKLGFPVKDQAKDAKTLSFDLSTFIPLIAQIYDKTSDHKFHLTVTDGANQKVTKTLWFHLTAASSVTYNSDADLWKNTATLSATVWIDGEVKIEYRKKGAADWQAATVTKVDDNNYKGAIAPTWKAEGKHATGVDQFSLDNSTGVFAGNAYEYRLTVAGNEVDKQEFKADKGQEIPFGDMNTWSKYIGYNSEWAGDPEFDEYKTYYPNKSVDEQFWANGNNAFTQNLCVPDTLSTTNYAAKVKGELAFGMIFAAGNMFSGIFQMEGTKGYARFGQQYAYTARPSAIKVRMKTSINTITHVNATLTPPNEVKVGDTDPSRFFVCITDWSDRHSVCSGMIESVAEINPFDPASDAAEPAEGTVIAYGSKTFTESITDWVDVIIPILYKDKEAKPAADKYSLVISTASSAYGDYLCGCAENELVVDSIEWVY